VKMWVVQITETRVQEITVWAETKEEAKNLNERFLAEILKETSLFSEVEIEVLGEAGEVN